MASKQTGLRKAVVLAAQSGIPAPSFFSALAYFDGYRSEVLPANLLQAQRDYFGAHTYERVDAEPGQKFHTHWQEEGRPERKA
jgi:6-phosphogluconate dehydrogenase